MNFSLRVRFFRWPGRCGTEIHLLPPGLIAVPEPIQHQVLPCLVIPQENPADPLHSGSAREVSLLLSEKMREVAKRQGGCIIWYCLPGKRGP